MAGESKRLLGPRPASLPVFPLVILFSKERSYLKKYGVSGDLPNDEGWTGAEIKECCRKAYRLNLTLIEAAQYMVPVSRSAAEQIKVLRQMASGKFISVSMPGVYRYEEESTAVGRRMIRRNEPLTILAPPRSEA